jgi:hypothetical protein
MILIVNVRLIHGHAVIYIFGLYFYLYFILVNKSVFIYYAKIERLVEAVCIRPRKKENKLHKPTTSPVEGNEIRRPILINIGTLGDLDDLISCVSFGSDRIRGFLLHAKGRK